MKSLRAIFTALTLMLVVSCVTPAHAQLRGPSDRIAVSGGSLVMTANGTLTQSGTSAYTDIPEITAPGNPAADTARFYSKDDTGTTKLCYKDSAGVETCIGDGGVDLTGITNNSLLKDNADAIGGSIISDDGTDISIPAGADIGMGTHKIEYAGTSTLGLWLNTVNSYQFSTHPNVGFTIFTDQGIRLGSAASDVAIYNDSVTAGVLRVGNQTAGTSTLIVRTEVDNTTNYQDLSLSVVDGTATIACLEAGTGSDNCDIDINALGSGNLVLSTESGGHVRSVYNNGLALKWYASTTDPAEGGVRTYRSRSNNAPIAADFVVGGTRAYAAKGGVTTWNDADWRLVGESHFVTTEAHGASAAGTDWHLSVTPTGATTPIQALAVSDVGFLGVGPPAPSGILSLGDVVNEGGTGEIYWFWAYQKHTLAASTSSTTTFSPAIASGDLVYGCLKTVDTTVVDDAGDDTWSAAWDASLASTAMGSGIAAAQNTKSNFLFAPLKATGVAQVVFTPNAGNFSAGVIEIMCLVQSTTNMADA